MLNAEPEISTNAPAGVNTVGKSAAAPTAIMATRRGSVMGRVK